MKRRNTKHKQAILKALEKHHLLSAGELVDLVPQADESTIYRNLKRLTKDGVLRSIKTDSVAKYELADKHAEHDHFVCDNCEAIEAIFIDEAAIRSTLPTNEDFSVTVRGTCEVCT